MKYIDMFYGVFSRGFQKSDSNTNVLQFEHGGDAMRRSAGHSLCRALEPRIMLDASFSAGLSDVADMIPDAAIETAHDEGQPMDAAEELLAMFDGYVPPATQDHEKSSVVFIDAGVDSAEDLIEALPQGVDVFMLDANKDGVKQMADILKDRQNLQSVHVYSHGDSGQVLLGDSTLNSKSLASYGAEFEVIKSALGEEADMLFYGCNFGQDHDFVKQLAEITGADIAASDDLTGASHLGGDWDLETTYGDIETTVMAVSSYSHVLAPPSLADIEATVIYVENNVNTTPELLDADVTLSDGGTVFDGLDLVISHDGGADDQIAVRSLGFGFDQIGVAGVDVSYQGSVIGEIDAVDDGVNGNDLRITLNANATEANVERLIENITYANISDTPVENRDVTIAIDVTNMHTMTVTVNASNDAPVVTAATFNVDEDAANTTAVGTVSITDDSHSGTSISFSITAGNDDGIFDIDNAGNITVLDNTNLHFDTTQQYSLTVQADDTIATGSETITIDINSIFDDTQVIIDDTTFVVTENTANGILVGTLPINDIDTLPGGHIVNISTGNVGGVFAINNIGELTVAGPIDRETKDSYELVIFASDGINSPDMAVISVIVVDENDVVPQIDDYNFVLDENTPISTLVGTVPPIDPDLVSPKTYTITAGNTGNVFAVDNSGNITVNGALDEDTTPQYVLTLEIDDTFGNDTATITIDLNDLEDESPVMGDQVMGVDEDAAIGTVVGNVGATDADDASVLEYRILSGNTDDAFSIDSNGNIITAKEVDFETLDNYAIQVEVRDTVNPVDVATITVNLNDVNDAPVFDEDMLSSGLSVAENSDGGTVVGDVLVTDADVDGLTYTIVSGNDLGFFAIDGNGEITLTDQADINFEKQSLFNLGIDVFDGTVTTNEVVAINIENLGDVFFINSAATNIEAVPDAPPARFETFSDIDPQVQVNVEPSQTVLVSEAVKAQSSDVATDIVISKSEITGVMFANDIVPVRQSFLLRDADVNSEPVVNVDNTSFQRAPSDQIRVPTDAPSINAAPASQDADLSEDFISDNPDLQSGTAPVNLLGVRLNTDIDVEPVIAVDPLPANDRDGVLKIDIEAEGMNDPAQDLQSISPEAGQTGLQDALEAELMIQNNAHQDFMDLFATP